MAGPFALAAQMHSTAGSPAHFAFPSFRALSRRPAGARP